MSTESNVMQAEGATTLAALLVELDGVIVETRTAIHRAAAAKLGKALTRAIFTDHGLHGSLESIAQSLVDHTGSGASVADLAADLRAAVTAQLDRAGIAGGIDKILKEAAKRHIPVALVTALPQDLAQAAADRLGLTERGAKVIAFPEEEKAFPRADIWLKAAKSLGKTPRFCVSFTSSQLACKTALSAGMRCVAVPDSFTGHQDFGGADLVVDSWDDVTASDLLNDVVPMVR